MKLDDENLDPSRPMPCREPDLAASKFDMIKSISWGGWLARARLGGNVNEVAERRDFEDYWRGLGDGAA